MQNTPRGYKKFEGTDRVMRQDFVDIVMAMDGDNTQQDTNLANHKTASTLDHPDNSVTDAKIGNRTITDTVTAAAGAGTLTNLLSKLGNMIKRITGKSNWYTAPAITLEDVSNHTTATSAAHAASAISSTATGGIAATNVQAAIVELESEKLALSGGTMTGSIILTLSGITRGGINSNGSIKLGDTNGVTNVGAVTPYIDWHYAMGSTQNFNVRQINNADGRMVFQGNAINNIELCIVGVLNGVRHGLMLGNGAYGYLDYDTGGSQVRLSTLNNLVFGRNSNATHNASTFTEYMRITSDGNVGIGTSSPGSLLHVQSTGSGTNGIILSQPSTGFSPFLTWRTGDTVNPQYSIRYISGASGGLTFGLGDSSSFNNMVRFSNEGKLGVGTSSPSYNLDVVGNINASTGVYVNGVAVAPGGYGLGVAAKYLAVGYDLNSLRGTGFFMGYGLLNQPGSTYGWVSVIAMQNTAAGDILRQMATNILGNTYTRFSVDFGATWSAWKQFATTDLIPAGAGAVKAHVNFSYNGGVITIRNSFNVSSVVRNSAGIYTVNFAASLASANYTVQCTAVGLGTGVRQGLVASEYMSAANVYGTKTTNAIAIITVTNNDSDTAVADVGSCNVTILQ